MTAALGRYGQVIPFAEVEALERCRERLRRQM